MVQLYINGKLCDIDEEMDIKLEKSFDNQDEHVIDEAEYSFEVELPITKRNREVFGFVDVFDVGNKFSQNYDAILNVDETKILVGKFIMDEIDDEYYSGNLYVPSSKSLKDVLGDKKMNAIKEHIFDISSWQSIKELQEGIINNTATDRHIAFPYVLYRLPYNNSDSTLPITTQDLSSSGSAFTTETVFPAFNVLSVLKDVFEGDGYNIQGNIFEMDKFKELYQTFSYDYKNYHEDKVVPYYVNFNLSYNLRTNDNTSSTARIVDIFGDPSMAWGTDAVLLSENTVFHEINDVYNMLVKGKNTEARTLVVPKSGWYVINISGGMSMPVKNGYWKQDNRINVDGRYNEADRVDLSQNIMEFQVKKTDTPLSNSRLYSYNCATPINPTNLSKEDVVLSDEIIGYENLGITMSYDDARNKFPKNNAVALVKDYSGDDTSDFVCGARWGCQFSYDKYSDNRNPDRRSNEMVFTCLPDPTKATMRRYTDDGGVDHMFMPLYHSIGIRRSDSDIFRSDYGSQTAQVLARYDSFTNFQGYNKFTPNTNGSGGTWDTTSDFEKRSYDGLYYSQAYTTSTIEEPNSPIRGGMMINTCVWLEEGDSLSIELMMPYNNYRDECGTFEFCDWKNRDRAGVVNTSLDITFMMGFVSSDEKYVPTLNNPIPSDATDPTDWYNSQRKYTNVNKFLGDTKVNEWIENLLNTFNLKLSKINANTYSIDTMMGEAQTYGNIVDIDKWANVKDAKFKRIDTKNTTLSWTISTDEEGYVHGNDTRADKTIRDESGYTGSITFTDGTTTKEDKVKSNYSYTWMKDITFVNGGLPFRSGVKEVPVIGDAELWENTYITIQDKDFATDKTSRLIYLAKDPDTMLYDYFNIQGFKNDTEISEVKAPLIFCKNYITYKNALGGYDTFRLDYNNTLSTENDKTITDLYFNINTSQQYEIDVPVKLPNDIYAKIKANTLVKFNDGLYRVMGIEGHNVNMNDEATLKLITLK